ncbi:hypothetical protein [Chromohalobacter sp.]|uniref:hypothetical protein n=1 Tax=Chromohalobacter sp. TaxID=50740 RepID=UPI001DF51445|nr:hypothetical protein [Chromohalobacter sp.]NQY44383.1 hypothetical protein [Chromohalobacter sp.]
MTVKEDRRHLIPQVERFFATLYLKNACARPYGVKNRLERQPGQNAHLPRVNWSASPVRFSSIFALSGHRSSIFQTELRLFIEERCRASCPVAFFFLFDRFHSSLKKEARNARVAEQ